MSVADFMEAVLLTLATLGLVYLAIGSLLVLRLGYSRAIVGGERPSVTILKPLHGAEPDLYDNLASFCRQDYEAAVQIIFGLQSASDSAVGIAEAIRRDFPASAIQLVIDPAMHGANRKVSNLVNMEREIRHDVVVLSDSDMRVGPDYLARVVAELHRPGIGAVTCLYHGRPAGNIWSEFAALGIDTHFLPSVAVGAGLGLAKPCFGSTIALRRGTLDAIGGFRSVADELADDYMIGAAIRRLGLRVAIPAFTVGHTCAERSFAELARQELRWARTIRRIDPVGHAGSLLAHPLALALLAFVLSPGVLSVTCAVAAWVLRIWACLAVERAFGVKRHRYRLVPVRDILSFGIFVASFLGRGVSWRGHSYSVAPSGALIADDKVLSPR